MTLNETSDPSLGLGHFRFYSPQPAAHLTRQAVDVITREKNASKSPVIIAPTMLVAAKVIPSRTIAARIVPKIPVKRTGTISQTQPLTPVLRIAGAAIRVSPR